MITQPPAESNDQPVVPSFPLAIARQQPKHFEDPRGSYLAHKFFLASTGNVAAQKFLAAQSVESDPLGGYTVPAPLSDALINLLEDHGVARRSCRRVNMGSRTMSYPKVAGHAQISYVDEAAVIPETDMTFGQVLLTAKKIASLVKLSTEVQEDSVINMIDTVVQSIGYSLAQAEDENLFNGVVGGVNAEGILGNSFIAERSIASTGDLSLEHFTELQSLVTQSVEARPAIYMNERTYRKTVLDLLHNAAGGLDIRQLESKQGPTLFGYPVVFVPVMNPEPVSGDLVAVFGDLSLAAYFGARRSVSFKLLDELYAETDQIGVQCTERVAIEIANPELLSRIVIA